MIHLVQYSLCLLTVRGVASSTIATRRLALDKRAADVTGVVVGSERPRGVSGLR